MINNDRAYDPELCQMPQPRSNPGYDNQPEWATYDPSARATGAAAQAQRLARLSSPEGIAKAERIAQHNARRAEMISLDEAYEMLGPHAYEFFRKAGPVEAVTRGDVQDFLRAANRSAA